ncbi:MAG: hypothetical protein JWN80_2961 [Microbacteriaceae bacterium]|nr:hypothetical protein [Microbacteriaceae bacterium]
MSDQIFREGSVIDTAVSFDATTVRVGDELSPLVREITRTTIFIFSAAYFGTHRFHYDVEASRAQGFDDVIVTANLICSYFEQAVRAWTGDSTYLRVLEERSVVTAFAGDPLRITGSVGSVEQSSDGYLIACELNASSSSGQTASTCHVELLVPHAVVPSA